jgi:hypothetical protein
VTYAELEPNEPERACAHWATGFTAIAPFAHGVWVVGSCGVRVRIDGGRLERFSTPVEKRPVLFSGECVAHVMHWSVAARSRSEAWILASPRCGADPNAVWPNELERFDGKRWRKSYSSFGVASGKPTGASMRTSTSQLRLIKNDFVA